MNRRHIVLVAAAWPVLAFAVSPVLAQQRKIIRIGLLSNRAEKGAREAAFVSSLRELGYVEGRNIAIEWRFVAGKLDRLPGLAAELVNSKVDILVASGMAAALAAKQATNEIPIVMAAATGDPVREGLVASLARPGGNVTGFANVFVQLGGKRLELLKQLVPKMSRVAILWDSTSPAALSEVKEIEVAARALGMQLQSLEVRRPDDFESAFRAAIKGRADALFIMAYGLFGSHQARIVALEAKTRLPAINTSPDFVITGGLMSYAPDTSEQYRRTATFVDKILKGAKPGELPIEQPTKFELVINLKTAKALGIQVPYSLLLQATRVIE